MALGMVRRHKILAFLQVHSVFFGGPTRATKQSDYDFFLLLDVNEIIRPCSDGLNWLCRYMFVYVCTCVCVSVEHKRALSDNCTHPHAMALFMLDFICFQTQ